MLCKVGQYYEASLARCRSCKIPCSLSEDVCKDVGCELFRIGQQQNASTTTTAVQLGDADDGTAIIWAPLTAALLVLIVIVITLAAVLIRNKVRKANRRDSSKSLLTCISKERLSKPTMEEGTQPLDDNKNVTGYC